MNILATLLYFLQKLKVNYIKFSLINNRSWLHEPNYVMENHHLSITYIFTSYYVIDLYIKWYTSLNALPIKCMSMNNIAYYHEVHKLCKGNVILQYFSNNDFIDYFKF
jgi:hypothetical protein